MNSMKAFPGVSLALVASAAFGWSMPTAPAGKAPAEPQQGAQARGEPRKFDYESVALNPDHEIPAGFRGEVHPSLHGETRLDVSAHWTPTLSESKRGGIKLGVIDNASAPEYSIPDGLVAMLTETTAAVERATYDARDLSVFLPHEILGPGQMWTIDPERAVAFLAQFHARASISFDQYSNPYGRRPGPAGAFGILRAVSPDYLDVLFRVHAEFILSERVLYTPACFLGRMVVDRKAGTVDYFQMRVPTDRAVNLNLTLTFRLPDAGPELKRVTNIVFEHVDPMELEGGNGDSVAHVDWQNALEVEHAHARLKSAFYKFMDVEWVPAETVVELAQELRKPIMAVVLTSPLDDQSC